MDQFTVPQFIEHEAKIVGPLTFKQFAFIGGAAGLCFIFYFTLPFLFFILAGAVVMGVAATLAFFKSGGRSLPVVLKNLIIFSLSPKMYLWKKKDALPPKIIEQEPASTKEFEAPPVPTIVGKSRLNNLSVQVETKARSEE